MFVLFLSFSLTVPVPRQHLSVLQRLRSGTHFIFPASSSVLAALGDHWEVMLPRSSQASS